MTTQYKHYSFDLWMTLIKSNPEFKIERAKYFFKNFNSRKKRLEEVLSVFRNIDLMCNSINEKTGRNVDADEMYLMVISMLNDFDTSFTEISLEGLYEEMDSLLFNYMPTLYSAETFETLKNLKQLTNSSFSISSNTAFIKGRSLRKVLSHLELSQFFDFHLYSDEINASKPNKYFFETMLKNVKTFHGNTDILLKEIIHIGDNPNADIEGAISMGLNCIQINSNSKTIAHLLN